MDEPVSATPRTRFRTVPCVFIVAVLPGTARSQFIESRCHLESACLALIAVDPGTDLVVRDSTCDAVLKRAGVERAWGLICVRVSGAKICDGDTLPVTGAAERLERVAFAAAGKEKA